MSKINSMRLNIEIENSLYPLVSLLKQTGAPKTEIIIEIENFRERYKDLLLGLDKNYIEDYLNRIYSKRNNEEMIIKKASKKIEER